LFYEQTDMLYYFPCLNPGTTTQLDVPQQVIISCWNCPCSVLRVLTIVSQLFWSREILQICGGPDFVSVLETDDNPS